MTVPPGAVSEPVTIRLSEVDAGDVAPLPSGSSRIGALIAFEPHGLSFDEPVVVTLGHDGSTADERRVLRLDDEDDASWGAVAGAIFAARTVTFESRTFSILVPVGSTTGGGGSGGGGGMGGGAGGMGGAGAGGATGGAGAGAPQVSPARAATAARRVPFRRARAWA